MTLRYVYSIAPSVSAPDIDRAALPGIDDSRVRAIAERDLAAVASDLPEDEWRDDWAAFRVPGEPQVDIVLTRAGSVGDAHHRRAWELLRSRPDLLAEYRALKASPGDYERRKADFFDRVVSQLPQ